MRRVECSRVAVEKGTWIVAGTELDTVPEDKRCCLHYLWVNKKTGASLCYAYNLGKECKDGKHVKPEQCTKQMKETKLYHRLVAERGNPNCPPKGPAAPTKLEQAKTE